MAMPPPLHLNRGVALGGDLLEDRVVDRRGRAGRNADESNPGGNQRRNYDFAHSLLPFVALGSPRGRAAEELSKRRDVNCESPHRLVSAAI